jgi:hypothetical protein
VEVEFLASVKEWGELETWSLVGICNCGVIFGDLAKLVQGSRSLTSTVGVHWWLRFGGTRIGLSFCLGFYIMRQNWSVDQLGSIYGEYIWVMHVCLTIIFAILYPTSNAYVRKLY